MPPSLWKLSALMKKNVLEMKRNIRSTICEILFPIILMILLYWLKTQFDVQTIEFDQLERNLENFIKNRSTSNIDFLQLTPQNISWYGLSIFPPLSICSPNNLQKKQRPIIASIGIPLEIKQKLMLDSQIFKKMINFSLDSLNNFKDFDSIDDMNSYIKSNFYGESEDYPLICFGMTFSQNKQLHEYNYSLHYFENAMNDGAEDVPKSLYLIDQFQSGPDLTSYSRYQMNGYSYMQKIISEYILSQESENYNNTKLNFGVVPMKYKSFRVDPFGTVVGSLGPFFIIIAYMGHLCIYVYRMVLEKETKAKEGMKIMGLTDSVYFLSYFLQYLVINLFVSLINAFIFTFIFVRIPFLVFFFIFLLFSLNIFALAYFFQSFIDKAKESLILSLLLYFIMFCLSMLPSSDDASYNLKMGLSVFPPVTIFLGIILLGKFESHFRYFYFKDIMYTFTNYSVFTMFAMLIIDLLLYLFLGYYLQNVLPHDFGVRKPWYFIFTPKFWGCRKKAIVGKNDIEQKQPNINKENSESNEENDKMKNGLINSDSPKNPNFQSEDIYKDRTNPDDCLRLHQIVKRFDDGKVAVDHVDLNFYKNEIFALLGHNGAGKTTLISILTGLYEATEGEAIYENMNILDHANIDLFREKIGICPQHDVLFNDLNIREHLSMFSIFKGVSSENVEHEINKIIHDFQLEDVQDTLAKNLSAGQRRKLSIAISLVGGSKIIFLDEPSSGMDITSRRNLWEILKRQTENKIIILTTHYMEEANVLGQRIGIINLGKMKCIGTPLFLIEKYGKYMSLTLSKDENADNNTITNFIQRIFNDSQFESLSEEIIVRIPKNNFNSKNNNNSENDDNIENNNTDNGCSLNKFFEMLDSNLENLKIKSYTVSMPTLEDVFLNVAAEDDETQRISRIIESNQKQERMLFEFDYIDNFHSKSKFISDFKSNLIRRFYLTIRDRKGFIMEVLCPIILVWIGSLLSKVTIYYSSPPFTTKDISSIGKQKVYYGMFQNSSQNIDDYFINGYKNVTSEYLSVYDNYTLNIGDDKKMAVQKFVDCVYNTTIKSESTYDNEIDMHSEKYIGYYGNLLLLNEPNDKNNNYEFVELINSRVVAGIPIYTSVFLEKIINKEAGHPVKINYKNQVMANTAKQDMTFSGNNGPVSLFIAIAFSLIPANFITIIVKERNNNSKHLMRLAGVNTLAYWIVNYIFELLKYYFTGGLSILVLYLFDYYTDYLIYFYLLYGPPLVSFTYFVSYFFTNESSAQNKMILLHSLIGSLGSSVIIILRQLEKTKKVGIVLEYIFSLLPSFSFNFAYNLSLSKLSIYQADYPNEWKFFGPDEIIKRFNLLMGPLVYLVGETIIYTLILFLIEYFSYNNFSKSDDSDNVNENNEEESLKRDSGVIKEEIRARKNILKVDESDNDKENLEEQKTETYISTNTNELQEKLVDKDSNTLDIQNNNNNNNNNFVVRVKNLKRIYNNSIYQLFSCFSNKGKVAVKNLNFCVEKGECFGLLGLNGAGKTTTFKCITQELNPSGGSIYINGINIKNHFNDFKSVFGYCPQYDAIFEYLTVYENLEFYAKLKGVKKEYLSQIVNVIIFEMRLEEFSKKIAGRLSGGNKRKLSVAISMLCCPPIVLLDEPSTGMDPEARRFMWSIIHKMSTMGKKSSIIMTTHSMDEAETLCKRMAIMVNGEFVCLGKANEIKTKYGYGYELNIRIKPMTDEQQKIMFFDKYPNLSKDIIVDKNNIEEVLSSIGREDYDGELVNGRLGEKIMRDIAKNNGISIKALLNWIFFVENALKFIRFGKDNFEKVVIQEHMDNNFLFKMKRKDDDNHSIGYLFGLFEVHKESCFITEYSIQMTSLEQIFNKFAQNQSSVLVERRSTVVEPGDVENISMSLNERQKIAPRERLVVNDELLNSLIKDI